MPSARMDRCTQNRYALGRQQTEDYPPANSMDDLFSAALASLASRLFARWDSGVSGALRCFPRWACDAQSLFGLPNYSAKVQALLKQDNEHARNEYGCNDYQSGFLPQPAVGGPMAEPVALVALVRGNCSFGVKALKAQAAGASAIIVYDGFIDQPDELPKMAGGDKTLLITIPGMLVLHSNGMILQQAYNNYLIAQKHGESTSPFYDGIWVSLSYSLIASDDRVVWDLFTFPGETSTAPFIAAFQPIFKALGDRALFTPHMRIMDGDMLRCLPDEGVACTRENLPCGTQCTKCGRYCRLSPNGKQGPTGADVLTQAVLQQ